MQHAGKLIFKFNLDGRSGYDLMESRESAPTEKNAPGNAVNLAKERENLQQIIHQIPIMSTFFFFASKHNKERRQKEKQNQQQTKRKKNRKKKSRNVVSRYAVTPLPVLLTTYIKQSPINGNLHIRKRTQKSRRFEDKF